MLRPTLKDLRATDVAVRAAMVALALMCGLLLPLVEEVGKVGGVHVAHVGELVVLAEDDVAAVVENG